MDGQIHQADQQRFGPQPCLSQLKSEDSPPGLAVTRYHGLSGKKEERHVWINMMVCCQIEFFQHKKDRVFQCVFTDMDRLMFVTLLSLVGYISDHENGVTVF